MIQTDTNYFKGKTYSTGLEGVSAKNIKMLSSGLDEKKSRVGVRDVLIEREARKFSKEIRPYMRAFLREAFN